MKMALVKSGEVILDYIPSTYNNISNYHLLPEEYLLGKGWLPLDEVVPEYDGDTQQLTNPSYEILTDKVIKSWEVVELPPQEPDEVELLKNRLDMQDMVIEEMMFGIIPELMGGR